MDEDLKKKLCGARGWGGSSPSWAHISSVGSDGRGREGTRTRGPLEKASQSCGVAELRQIHRHTDGDFTDLQRIHRHTDGDFTDLQRIHRHTDGDFTDLQRIHRHADGDFTDLRRIHRHADGDFTDLRRIHRHTDPNFTELQRIHRHTDPNFADLRGIHRRADARRSLRLVGLGLLGGLTVEGEEQSIDGVLTEQQE
ncbi:MAG: hypothetical protein IPI35_20125 [Deltaproteobacteria bacterium]|nr:hypothetical protein [Deltaproteobacteria bacterium]